MSDVLRGSGARAEPDLAAQRGVPDAERGGDVRHTYRVRWRELDAHGNPFPYTQFAEWSCGHPREWPTAEGAQAHADYMRRDALDGLTDYIADITVVRAVDTDWEVVDGL